MANQRVFWLMSPRWIHRNGCHDRECICTTLTQDGKTNILDD